MLEVHVLKQLISTLFSWRNVQVSALNEIEQLQKELEESPTYQRLQDVKKVLAEYKEQEALAREDLLKYGMDHFNGDNKHPVPGVQVKEFKKVVVTDPKKAMIWASEYCPTAIKLDEKKLASAVVDLNVDFVSQEIEYRPNLVEKELNNYE